MSRKTLKHKEQKQTHRKPVSVFVTVFCMALLIYILYSIVDTRLDIRRKEAQLEELKQRYQEQVMENEELAGLIEEGDEASYFERVAREQRGYVYADERVYQDVTPGMY